MFLKMLLTPRGVSRPVSVGQHGRAKIRPIARNPGGRPMSLGQGSSRADAWAPGDPCTTYENPEIPIGDDGCPAGYNGCGDTVGVRQTVAAGATVDVQVQSGIVITPRYFIYTGTEGAFLINNVRVANGGSSHFGPGILADIYRFTNFVNRGVAWPTFFNSPPLLINVTSLAGQDEDFEGVIIGVAAHQ